MIVHFYVENMNNCSYNKCGRMEILMYINDKVINKMEETLKVAGDGTRLKILFCLLDEFDQNQKENGPHFVEKCVNDIALQVGSSQSLVSHQLKVLKDSGFVKANKVGTKIFYSLKDEHVQQIMKITYEHVLEDNDNE